MRGAVRLGRVVGIPVGVHYTWFIALWVLTWSLARTYFPTRAPGLPPDTYWAMGLLAAVLLFGSVVAHEVGHALMARRYGIRTRSIVLFLFGGVAHIVREPPTPSAELAVALAGPATSLGVAALAAAGRWAAADTALGALAGYLAWANTGLAVFNMIPGFPLDGGRALRALIWSVTGDLTHATRVASRAGQGVAVAFIAAGILLAFTGNVVGGLWLLLLGWFLDAGAQAGYQQVLLRQALGDVRVADVMSRALHTVDPSLTLDELISEYFLPLKHGGFPVVWGDRLLGIVTLQDVKEIPRERRAVATVRDVMTPLHRLRTVRPGASAYEAFERMTQDGIGRVLVVDDDGTLVGILTRSDLLHLLRLREELGEIP
ncbi:MAG: site-2 protease family protein [Armatimonadota bacterium]|nr:site-2 protease family protein [Armatimonadota bacterium]MDR7612856.1 site-2 protease family protein [Armatimonadota bacterium]